MTTASIYWIPLEGAPRCAFLDERRIEHYRVAPQRGEALPRGDVALTYLLWIRSDPDGFHAAANVLRSERLELQGGRAEIAAVLAEAQPKPVRRRRRYRAPLNQTGIARASALRERLDADSLRGFLERNGNTLPDEVIRRLAQSGDR